MLYWIFDLDYTLYQLPEYINFNYNFLSKDTQLNYLLTMLPCNKILFTNGNTSHAIRSLEILGIKDKFISIYSRDNVESIKPDVRSFNSVIKASKIKNTDKVVFFEDTVDNLITAKSLGWITVLINKKQALTPEVDFWFPNIHIALNYFVNCIQSRQKK